MKKDRILIISDLHKQMCDPTDKHAYVFISDRQKANQFIEDY